MDQAEKELVGHWAWHLTHEAVPGEEQLLSGPQLLPNKWRQAVERVPSILRADGDDAGLASEELEEDLTHCLEFVNVLHILRADFDRAGLGGGLENGAEVEGVGDCRSCG